MRKYLLDIVLLHSLGTYALLMGYLYLGLQSFNHLYILWGSITSHPKESILLHTSSLDSHVGHPYAPPFPLHPSIVDVPICHPP
jgi:hypothetical protein